MVVPFVAPCGLVIQGSLDSPNQTLIKLQVASIEQIATFGGSKKGKGGTRSLLDHHFPKVTLKVVEGNTFRC